MAVLRYGTDSSVALKFDEGVPWEQCGTPDGVPLANPAAAIAAALEQPLEYPPLAQTTTPGDRVVVVLGSDLPQVAQITAAIIRALMTSGVDADGITILRSEDDADGQGRSTSAGFRAGGRADPHSLARAGQSAEPGLFGGLRRRRANPLESPTDRCRRRVARRLHATRALGRLFGIHTTIYPEYSDHYTQARFRKHDRFIGNGHHRELQHEVNHVAWLLGVNFSLQVVPAAGDGILHVLAGQSDVVRRQCRELYRAAWQRSVAQRASPSWQPSKRSGSRPGRTWAACWRAPQVLSKRAGRLPSAATWRRPGSRFAAARWRAFAGRGRAADPPRQSPRRLARPAACSHFAEEPYLPAQPSRPRVVEDLEMIPIGGPDELVRLARETARAWSWPTPCTPWSAWKAGPVARLYLSERGRGIKLPSPSGERGGG